MSQLQPLHNRMLVDSRMRDIRRRVEVIQKKLADLQEMGVPCAFCYSSIRNTGSIFTLGDKRITDVIEEHRNEILCNLMDENSASDLNLSEASSQEIHLILPVLPAPLEELSRATLQSMIVGILKDLGIRWSDSTPVWWPADIPFVPPRSVPDNFSGNWVSALKKVLKSVYSFFSYDIDSYIASKLEPQTSNGKSSHLVLVDACQQQKLEEQEVEEEEEEEANEEEEEEGEEGREGGEEEEGGEMGEEFEDDELEDEELGEEVEEEELGEQCSDGYNSDGEREEAEGGEEAEAEQGSNLAAIEFVSNSTHQEPIKPPPPPPQPSNKLISSFTVEDILMGSSNNSSSSSSSSKQKSSSSSSSSSLSSTSATIQSPTISSYSIINSNNTTTITTTASTVFSTTTTAIPSGNGHSISSSSGGVHNSINNNNTLPSPTNSSSSGSISSSIVGMNWVSHPPVKYTKFTMLSPTAMSDEAQRKKKSSSDAGGGLKKASEMSHQETQTIMTSSSSSSSSLSSAHTAKDEVAYPLQLTKVAYTGSGSSKHASSSSALKVYPLSSLTTSSSDSTTSARLCTLPVVTTLPVTSSSSQQQEKKAVLSKTFPPSQHYLLLVPTSSGTITSGFQQVIYNPPTQSSLSSTVTDGTTSSLRTASLQTSQFVPLSTATRAELGSRSDRATTLSSSPDANNFRLIAPKQGLLSGRSSQDGTGSRGRPHGRSSSSSSSSSSNHKPHKLRFHMTTVVTRQRRMPMRSSMTVESPSAAMAGNHIRTTLSSSNVPEKEAPVESTITYSANSYSAEGAKLDSTRAGIQSRMKIVPLQQQQQQQKGTESGKGRGKSLPLDQQPIINIRRHRGSTSVDQGAVESGRGKSLPLDLQPVINIQRTHKQKPSPELHITGEESPDQSSHKHRGDSSERESKRSHAQEEHERKSSSEMTESDEPKSIGRLNHEGKDQQMRDSGGQKRRENSSADQHVRESDLKEQRREGNSPPESHVTKEPVMTRHRGRTTRSYTRRKRELTFHLYEDPGTAFRAKRACKE